MADGQVVFEIKGDASNVNQTVKQVTGNIQQESKKWDQAVSDSTDKAGKSFLNWKTVAVGAITAISAAVVKFGKEAIDAASDLAEVQNVVDTVFGDDARVIDNWSKKAGEKFGLTETMAKRFTSTLGAMMKSSGLAGKEIVGMSTDLAGLAADMASFYNLDFETAFEKIRSGISGETMPLKQLGINMSVANLEAFALAQGLEKTFSEMSQGEQTMLRYQYLMQATADAQGDFEKTADGFANARRRVEANLESISTSIGNLLITPIENATNVVADFLKQIADNMMPEKTVIDRFNDIQLDTEGKLAEIQKTADEADLLSQRLQEIASSGSDSILSNIALGANKLDASTPGTWKAILNSLQGIDGLQNIFTNDSAGTNIESLASALSSSEVDADKAAAWQTFLGALAENADAVSKLTGKDVGGTVEWLNQMSEAVNGIDASDADAWDRLLTTLVSGFTTDTPEGKQFVEGLATQFLALGSESETAVKGLQALGFSSEEIDDKQKDWLETCKRLVSTIPGLNQVINTETGEVKGGINAVRDYVKAWEEGQTRLAYLKMHEEKGSALDQAYSDLPGLKLDADLAAYRMKKAYDKVRDVYTKYGKSLAMDNEGKIDISGWYGIDDADLKLLQEFKKEVEDSGLSKAYRDASDLYKKRQAEYNEAAKMYAEEGEMISEMFGENATEATEEAAEAMSLLDRALNKDADAAAELEKQWKSAGEALKSVSDYYKNVEDATRQAVNATLKGFNQVEKAADDLRAQKDQTDKDLGAAEAKYASLLGKYGGFEKIKGLDDKAWEKLPTKVKNAYNEIANLIKKQDELNASINKYSPDGMIKGLQSQIDYIDKYLENLKWAEDNGLSAGLLAQLADGSKESAEYLSQLKGADASTIESLNSTYAELEQKKAEYTKTLTDTKLTADEAYQALVDAAAAALGDLNLHDSAKESLAETVQGIADGVEESLPNVHTAVQAVIDELNRLSSAGINYQFDAGGNIEIVFGDAEPMATGKDWIPYDNYPALLHQGEAVLTAEENKIWQMFKNQQPNMDYDTLGGVMSESIKPGGDVYLDGRVVGQVMSDIQGNQYRTLQRSGWQQ